MKKITKFLAVFTFLAAVFVAQQGKAQVLTAKQAIFVSGGAYMGTGSNIKFYAYNIASKKIKAFDSVPGDFTNAAVISGDTAYLSADTILYRYNITTYKKIDSIILPGINRLKIYNNYLIVSRAYPATSTLVEIFNKNSLKLLYTDTHATNQANGIVVNKDTAYIAIQNDTFGLLEAISLSQATPQYTKLIKLDTTSRDLQDIFTDGVNIYGLSYSYSSPLTSEITYNLATRKIKSEVLATITKSMPTLAYINGVCLYKDSVYGNYSSGLQALSTTAANTFGGVIYPQQYTAGVFDSTDKDFFMITSNYFTPDEVYEVNMTGKITDSFMVGISTQAMAIQYIDSSTTTGIKPIAIANQHITLYPNPSNSTINLIYPAAQATITISDITGRIVYSENKTGLNSGASIDVSGFANGVYIVHLVSETGAADVKFIKE